MISWVAYLIIAIGAAIALVVCYICCIVASNAERRAEKMDEARRDKK